MKSLHKILLGGALALMATAAWAQGSTTRYYRHLEYNHNSPYEDYAPIHEITAEQAQGVGHYEAVYDAEGRLTELRNYSPEDWRRHPMTHLGAFRMTVQREAGSETRLFFDKDGARTRNLREVYKEVYAYDAAGEKTELRFYDLNDRPMNSNWGVARYTWERKNGMVIERRYNAQGALVPLAENFPFHISGMRLDVDGRIVEHCNLNDKLEVSEIAGGLACYKDIVTAGGDLVGISYYDARGRLAASPWRFAVVRQSYDKNGNVVVEEMTDKNGIVISRAEFAYDDKGRVIQKK